MGVTGPYCWLGFMVIFVCVGFINGEGEAVLVVEQNYGRQPTEGNLRLIHGNNPWEGTVEIWHLSRWGGVCDFWWTEENANVTCRQLGFPGARNLYKKSYFGRSVVRMWVYKMRCIGNETMLADCYHRPWGRPWACHPQWAAGVECYPGDPADGTIRLSYGSVPSEGTVEIFWAGAWGSICEQEFDKKDGAVICRQAGYSRGCKEVKQKAYFGKGVGLTVFDDVACLGTENHILQCPLPLPPYDHTCSYYKTHDVGVVCHENQEGDVRLMDGGDITGGRVEIFRDGAWGTICDDGWDWADANVVCRQKGYKGAIKATGHGDEDFGYQWGPIHTSYVMCTGFEDSLMDCPRRDGWTHACYHVEDAGVVCATEEDTPLDVPEKNMKVRIVGRQKGRGRVEINLGGGFGRVCDSDWSDNEAKAMCFHAGYPWAESRLALPKEFSQPAVETNPFIIGSIDCPSSENATLANCRITASLDMTCNTGDVGVVCASAN